jgi:hypothetical protein
LNDHCKKIPPPIFLANALIIHEYKIINDNVIDINNLGNRKLIEERIDEALL